MMLNFITRFGRAYENSSKKRIQKFLYTFFYILIPVIFLATSVVILSDIYNHTYEKSKENYSESYDEIYNRSAEDDKTKNSQKDKPGKERWVSRKAEEYAWNTLGDILKSFSGPVAFVSATGTIGVLLHTNRSRAKEAASADFREQIQWAVENLDKSAEDNPTYSRVAAKTLIYKYANESKLLPDRDIKLAKDIMNKVNNDVNRANNELNRGFERSIQKDLAKKNMSFFDYVKKYFKKQEK
ncbi:hypothetical protein [Rothia aeria]|uniref:hypothetical protein n=1 Tax=Rothia aeria TaxID=172042 RepID=UPI0028E44544|nr:hypothetical protein [Rothia aeria]